MEYFNPDEFIRELTSRLEPECQIQLRSREGEPLRYKITKSPVNFVYLYFSCEEDKVAIELDFSAYQEEGFDAYIIHACKVAV